MNIEKRMLKSISEFSMFKYVLVSYLIFFVLYIIVFAVVGLIGWALLASSGLTFSDILNNFMPGANINDIIKGFGLNQLGGFGGILGIIVFIIIGLVASVFAAALAALTTWIFNVVLRITGGIELRFVPVISEKLKELKEKETEKKNALADKSQESKEAL